MMPVVFMLLSVLCTGPRRALPPLPGDNPFRREPLSLGTPDHLRRPEFPLKRQTSPGLSEFCFDAGTMRAEPGEPSIFSKL
jgi:hypothetical protein